MINFLKSITYHCDYVESQEKSSVDESLLDEQVRLQFPRYQHGGEVD